MPEVRFTVPKGMPHKKVAKTFAAYLMGEEAFDNRTDRMGDLTHGPWAQPSSLKPEAFWQLDRTNNFFLHFKGEEDAMLSSRYESGAQIVRAMVELFRARYPQRGR